MPYYTDDGDKVQLFLLTSFSVLHNILCLGYVLMLGTAKREEGFFDTNTDTFFSFITLRKPHQIGMYDTLLNGTEPGSLG